MPRALLSRYTREAKGPTAHAPPTQLARLLRCLCGAHVAARQRGAARRAGNMTAAASVALRSLLAALCDAPWVTDALAELHGAGHASLAAQLRAALGPAAGVGACESVVQELWRHAQARRAAPAACRARAD